MQGAVCEVQLYGVFKNNVLWEQLSSLRVILKARKKYRSSVFWQKTKLELFGKWRWPDAFMPYNDESRSLYRTVALLVLASRVCTQWCKDSVQHGAVVTIKQSEQSKSCKSMINLSYLHSEYLVAGSWNCDGGCMFCRLGAVLYGTRQTDRIFLEMKVGLLPKWVCRVLVCNFRLERPHPLSIVLTSSDESVDLLPDTPQKYYVARKLSRIPFHIPFEPTKTFFFLSFNPEVVSSNIQGVQIKPDTMFWLLTRLKNILKLVLAIQSDSTPNKLFLVCMRSSNRCVVETRKFLSKWKYTSFSAQKKPNASPGTIKLTPSYEHSANTLLSMKKVYLLEIVFCDRSKTLTNMRGYKMRKHRVDLKYRLTKAKGSLLTLSNT